MNYRFYTFNGDENIGASGKQTDENNHIARYKMVIPSYNEIQQASCAIASFVHHTPVLTCTSINTTTGADIYFKCENFQKTGSFKYRGATHAVLKLAERMGSHLTAVATHSSGNHAAALSLAAQNLNLKAHIVMPHDAPAIKKRGVAQYQGSITFCEPTLVAREEALANVVRHTGAHEVHPYNNYDVICGQGTAAMELIESNGPFDVLMAPVGGGGLMGGTSIVTRSLLPDAIIVGCEPLQVADAQMSLDTGDLQPPFNKPTLADGLRTALCPLTFEVLRQNHVMILTCTEKSIVDAMRLIWERMKIVIEPSSAVPLAVVLENREQFLNARIGMILSGGNVDLERLPF